MEENKTTNNNLSSGIIWKFMERVVAQGISFVLSVILARILLPEDYGAVSIVHVFIEIANVFITSGLSTALIQKKRISEEEVSTIFYCCLALSIFLYVVLFFAAPFVASFYKLPILTKAIRVFALRLPIASFYQIPSALLSRKLDFKKFFLSTLVGTFISAVIGIFMAVQGFGPWALIVQNLVAAIIDAVMLSFFAKWRPKKLFSIKLARPLLNYGSKIMFSDVITSVFNNSSSMIIGYKYTSADLAYFTKGKTLPNIIRNNIYLTIISVLFPAMSKVGDDMSEIKNIARRSVKMLAYVIFPMMIGMIAVAENLVIVLYTEKWILMTPFIAIVCIECMVSIIPTIVLQTLKATGNSGIVLKLELIKKPLLIFSLLVALRFGVKAIAWSLTINSIIELLINNIPAYKIVGYKLQEQLKDILCPLLLSLGMGASIFAFQFIDMSAFLSLVLQTITGIASYILLSLIFKVNEFKVLLNFVKSKLPCRKTNKE